MRRFWAAMAGVALALATAWPVVAQVPDGLSTTGQPTAYDVTGKNHFVNCPDRDRFKRGRG